MLKVFQRNTKMLLFATILILSLGLTSLPGNVEASPPKIPGSEPELVFPVISDTQINSPDDLERFGNILGQLNEIALEQDAIVFNGDLTSHGYEEEYDGGMNVFNKYVQPQAEQLFTIGNHEYSNGSFAKESQQRFLEKTGMESLYYHKVINDYDFIVLGEESIGYYSNEQIKWLEEQLKQAEQRDRKKPIFVFMHWPLKNTVYGSDTWYFQTNQELLYDTLKQYPQVILFSGHLHYPISDPRAIHQKDFTSVNSGSVRYMWTEAGYLQGELPSGNERISNGLLVEVYNNRVVIKRRGFHANDWVGDPWIIKTPAKTNKFKYSEDRDKKSPYFKKDATLSVVQEKTTTTDLYIEFDQGDDNILVHSYRVTAKSKETGEVANEYVAFSEYYKANVPDKLTFPINGLQPGTEYDIEVRAIDAFGNESHKTLQTTGITEYLY